MDKFNYKTLSFKKVMISMGVIMIFWAVFWYPFYLFIFPKNMNEIVEYVIGVSREYIRTLPAIVFLIYYKDILKTNFKEMFSLKFNYKWFMFSLIIATVYVFVGYYFTHGKISFNPNKLLPHNIFMWISLGFCQEIVFRGWSFNAFKMVTSQKNAITLSSFFFAASHWFAHFCRIYRGSFDLPNFINVTVFTFIFGVAMCFYMIKVKDKSIVPISIFHAFWDLLMDIVGCS